MTALESARTAMILARQNRDVSTADLFVLLRCFNASRVSEVQPHELPAFTDLVNRLNGPALARVCS